MKDVYKTPFFLAVIINLIEPLVSSFTNHSEDCDLVDVVFLVPTSDDVSRSEITDLQRMLLFLLRGMPVAESQTRIGVVSYGSKVGEVVHLSGDRMLLGRSMLKIRAVGGPSNPRGGLNIAYNLLANDQRYAVPQIAVIVYKNVSSSSLALARLQANKMADADIRLITIGIGSSDLSKLAWAEDLTYNMATSGELLNITRDIPKYICKAIHTPRQLKHTTAKPVPLSTTQSVLTELNEGNTEETPTICDKAQWVNGVGYAPVEGYPENFAMCYREAHNVMTVSYKTCPFGQQWSEPDVTCIKFSRLETPRENNPLCQLLPIPGHPDKFQQLTTTGMWQEFDCPDGTEFSKDNCGCTRFRPAQYMAKQQQGPDSCTPELYLPFCGDLKDFSGKETHVQRIGDVRLREGKAYLDGRSSLYIPRFSGLEYGETIVIQFKYLAEEEDNEEIDGSNEGEEFSLISNGRCHDYYCEAPSISIRSRDEATVLQASSTGDDVTIISEHSRRKRATENEDDELSDLLSKLTDDSYINKENIKLYGSNLSSNDSQDEENSKEILNDIQQEYDVVIPENSKDDEIQVEKRPVLPGPLSLLTETTDNDFDIILEPFDIHIPTTTVKIPTTGNDIGKNNDHEDRVSKHENISVKDDQENIDDITDTTDDDHVPSYDIILHNTDETNLINEVIGFNSDESIGNTLIPDDDAKILNNEIDKVKNNFDIIFDDSSRNIDDLIDAIKDAVKNNEEKTVNDNQNNESKELYDNGTISDEESINQVRDHKIDDEEVFEHPKNENDTSREEISATLPKLSFSVTNLGNHDNNTNSSEEDASTDDLIKHVNVEIKEDNDSAVDIPLDTSIETSKEDWTDNSKTLTFNYSITDVENKDISDEISVKDEKMDTPKNMEDKSMEENETNTIYYTKSEPFPSEEVNGTGYSLDTEYDTVSSGETNGNNTNNTDVPVVGVIRNEGLKNESSKDAGADKWRIVTMKIKDGVIQASINGRREDDRYFRGRIKTTQSGLYIGSGTGGKNFKGYIDEVYIFLCDPQLETEEQKYRKLLHDRRHQQSANRKRNAVEPKCDYLNPRAHDWLRDRK